MIRRPARSTLFPNTTLFRTLVATGNDHRVDGLARNEALQVGSEDRVVFGVGARGVLLDGGVDDALLEGGIEIAVPAMANEIGRPHVSTQHTRSYLMPPSA